MADNNTTETTETVVERLPFHFLFAKQLRTYENWREWLATWTETQNFGQLISLLHDGFNVSVDMSQYSYDSLGRYRTNLPIYDNVDRLIFYLTVADGWRESGLLHMPGDRDDRYFLGHDRDGRRIEKNIVELRQMIAEKAFNMLCSKLFNLKLTDRDDGFLHMWSIITSERLFPHVMSFFRVQERYTFNPGEDFTMPNLGHPNLLVSDVSNNEKVATEFLLNLARFIWRWSPEYKPYFGKSDDDKQQAWEARVKACHSRIDMAKPWMIEVLSQLNRLDILQEWLLSFNQICLVKLKEIAFRNKLYQYESGERKVKTLDEACYLGSKSAWLLKEYELKKREGDRLSKIQEEQRRMEEAKRTIAELSSKKEKE